MKIESIAVKGLFSSYDISAQFSERGLTFIHSQNGIGKSTTLRMLVDLFNGDSESLASTPFKSMAVGVSGGHLIEVNNECGLRIKLDGNETEHSYIAGMADIIYMSTDRLFVTENGIILPAPQVYSEEIIGGYRYAKNDTSLNIGENKIDPSISDDEIIRMCRDIKARMDFIGDFGISPKLPDGIDFPPTRYDLTKDRTKYLTFITAAAEWCNRYYPYAESLSAYVDILNSLFNDKKITISEDTKNDPDGEKIFRICLNNGSYLPPNKLSAGEKQIMTIFYRLLFHCNKGSIAIIDEPEISLHVSWQQKIGSLFDEISRIRDIQIIVATHSPQIIHDMWDQAEELRPKRA